MSSTRWPPSLAVSSGAVSAPVDAECRQQQLWPLREEGIEEGHLCGAVGVEECLIALDLVHHRLTQELLKYALDLIDDEEEAECAPCMAVITIRCTRGLWLH